MATDPNALSATDPNTALKPLAPLGAPAPATTTPAVTNNALASGSSTAPAIASVPPIAPTGMIATTRTLDPVQGTVAGQLDKLTQSNSPLMVGARASSDQQMNARGLLNSSLAVSASDKAAYDAALPVANADATNYNTVAAQNQTTLNAANSQNATAANQATMFNADQSLKTGLANLDAQTKTNLADIEANYKVLMQTSNSAAQLYNQVVTNVSNISLSNTMDQAAKDAAVANQLSLLKTGMSSFGAMGNLNLSDLLNFNTTGNTVLPV